MRVADLFVFLDLRVRVVSEISGASMRSQVAVAPMQHAKMPSRPCVRRLALPARMRSTTLGKRHQSLAMEQRQTLAIVQSWEPRLPSAHWRRPSRP